MKESDVLHENGAFWVMKSGGLFHVMKSGVTHSESMDGVAYPDFTLARARCDYLARKAIA